MRSASRAGLMIRRACKTVIKTRTTTPLQPRPANRSARSSTATSYRTRSPAACGAATEVYTDACCGAPHRTPRRPLQVTEAASAVAKARRSSSDGRFRTGANRTFSSRHVEVQECGDDLTRRSPAIGRERPPLHSSHPAPGRPPQRGAAAARSSIARTGCRRGRQMINRAPARKLPEQRQMARIGVAVI